MTCVLSNKTAEVCGDVNIWLNRFLDWHNKKNVDQTDIDSASGLSPPVKYFTDRSKAVLLLWIFYVVVFCLVFAMHLYASVYLCFVVTCWERADILALVCGV